MNTELFISNRLFFDKTNQHFLSKKIIRIALIGIASVSLTSCGSKKEEAKETEEDAYAEHEAAEPAKERASACSTSAPP